MAESGVAVANVGFVISSGAQRRVSTDIRTRATANALWTLPNAQVTQQQGGTRRTDEGDHITMMNYDQYVTQVWSSDLAQLEGSHITPMIFRSLVAGRSFARSPFLSPPHSVVQPHAKESIFLHGLIDAKGLTCMGQAVACMDLPCDWAQLILVHMRRT